MSNLPTQAENPSGFHARYIVSKADGTPVDPDAVYLVLRIDGGGKDKQHIQASRAAAETFGACAFKFPHLKQMAIELLKRLDGYRAAENTRVKDEIAGADEPPFRAGESVRAECVSVQPMHIEHNKVYRVVSIKRDYMTGSHWRVIVDGGIASGYDSGWFKKL